MPIGMSIGMPEDLTVFLVAAFFEGAFFEGAFFIFLDSAFAAFMPAGVYGNFFDPTFGMAVLHPPLGNRPSRRVRREGRAVCGSRGGRFPTRLVHDQRVCETAHQSMVSTLALVIASNDGATFLAAPEPMPVAIAVVPTFLPSM